jgi:hypothetical protein
VESLVSVEACNSLPDEQLSASQEIINIVDLIF